MASSMSILTDMPKRLRESLEITSQAAASSSPHLLGRLWLKTWLNEFCSFVAISCCPFLSKYHFQFVQHSAFFVISLGSFSLVSMCTFHLKQRPTENFQLLLLSSFTSLPFKCASYWYSINGSCAITTIMIVIVGIILYCTALLS